MITFEYLSQLDTPHTKFPGNITTSFWEELYQLFKKRMEDEQPNKHLENDLLGKNLRNQITSNLDMARD